MPFVSLRNATFMKNEMTGINVTDEDSFQRYRADMSKKRRRDQYSDSKGNNCKRLQILLMVLFSFPFNRTHMLRDYWKEQSVSKAILLFNQVSDIMLKSFDTE